ncbi:2OG-Fe-II oxygenase family oxidoreductase [Mycena metata]|uniref:2OG-Fe-II oxygenase family oxidoreductase n=1 Tax=Mycena metata TaxID=1033252 RepID=A0AAD7NUD9_9AGAR|nr:2OG-Fe-II oxygenase family oxidoreductase [Mycena metata]
MPTLPGGLELSDERVPKASFSTIDFALLEARDAVELENLLRACQTHGFFYLNFDNSESTKAIVDEKTGVQNFMKEYFAQAMDVKMKDHLGIKTKGYIPYGTFTGLKKGDWRTVEHLMLSRWDFVSGADSVAPAVRAKSHLFKSYLDRCNYVVAVMLGALSDVLEVPASNRIDRGHDTSKPCDTTLAMLSYPLDIGETLQEHTDIGSMTVLFSHEYGLQVLAPETHQWEFVEPRDRHAVINVGDALRFMSDKQLYSCVHRVIRATGAYASPHRYSLAFLRRPEQDFKYKDTEGKELTAKEWHDSKYKIYYTPHEEQDSNVLLGGMERVLSETTHSVAVAA